LNAKLPLLDQYGRARQDASRKYSAAFEGHKNIVAQVFVIYVIVTSSSIYLTNCRWRPRRFNEILASKDIPCAIYYPIPLHSQKAYLDARYKEEDFQ
jgi:dTDP-4-amino-4,6-dideoxygalactose transaminase